MENCKENCRKTIIEGEENFEKISINCCVVVVFMIMIIFLTNFGRIFRTIWVLIAADDNFHMLFRQFQMTIMSTTIANENWSNEIVIAFHHLRNFLSSSPLSFERIFQMLFQIFTIKLQNCTLFFSKKVKE